MAENTTEKDIELAEKGTPSSRKSLSKTDTQIVRELNAVEVKRINAEYASNPSFRHGVLRVQAFYRGLSNRKKVEDKKMDLIMNFQRSIEERSPLGDMCIFLIFMMFFVFAVMWRVDYDSHYFVQIMRDWVIEEEFSMEDAAVYKNFGDIASEEEFWQFLKGPFSGNMFPDEGSEFFYGTAVVGSVRLRQIRVKDSGSAGCYVPKMLQNEFAKECYQELNDNTVNGKPGPGNNIATDAFGNATIIANLRNKTLDPYYNNFVNAFEYDAEKEARVTLHEAWRLAYPSKGGYIVRMPNNMGNAAASQLINDLHSTKWIDGATRAVIIEFAVYNKQTMIFVQTKLFVEFFTTGGAFTYPQFAVCKLASVGTATHLHHQSMALIFRIIVFAFVLVLILQEFRELYQEGVRGYFTSVWNYIDLINYGIFLIQMFYFISYYSFQDEVKDALESSDATQFVDIAYLSQLYNYVDYIAAVNMLLSTLKIFQYLEANKGIATIIFTTSKMLIAIVPLFIVLITFICSFSLAIYVGFNTVDYNLRSLRHTFITLLKASFGVESGEWEGKIMISDRTIGTGIVFLFRFFVGFFLISMVVTIVDVAYNDMKENIEEEFDNDVLVASLRIKLNKVYKWLFSKFPRYLPKAKDTAIPLSQALKAKADKKKVLSMVDGRSPNDDGKTLRRERSIVENINKNVKEEKDILRRASRPSGELDMMAKLAMEGMVDIDEEVENNSKNDEMSVHPDWVDTPKADKKTPMSKAQRRKVRIEAKKSE